MQPSIMNNLVPGFRFPQDFCGLPATFCSRLHTPLDSPSLRLPGVGGPSKLTASAVRMLAATHTHVPSHYIHLSVGPIKVDTRETRLPMATARPTTSGVGGNGLSSLCAQTLGQLTSKVPEFCFQRSAAHGLHTL